MRFRGFVGFAMGPLATLVHSTGLILLIAIVAMAPDRAQAQTAPLTPPALACIGNPACTGAKWQQVRYDCITGDHFQSSGSCPWLPSASAPTGGACNQPDQIPQETGPALRCDDWDDDFYERPFSSGTSGPFEHQLDIVYTLASQDAEWYYFLIQLYGVTSGKLDAYYDIEIDAEPAILLPPNCGTGKDDRPCPDATRALDPEGASCIDWLLRTKSPTANIRDDMGGSPNGYNKWGRKGVQAWYDWNEDEGGPNCRRSNFGVVMNGYELAVANEAAGVWPNGLWALMPSNCAAMAPAGYQDELFEMNADRPATINFTGSCVVLAARKDMIAAYLTRPVTAPSAASLAADHSLTWRGWSNKGEQDNQNLPIHDKYSNSNIGNAYRDESPWPTQKALFDSTARLGDLQYFGTESLVIVKDVEPDPAINEWVNFSFDVSGPTDESTVLQNPAKPSSDPAFGTPPWEYPDKVLLAVKPTQIFGGTYQITESTGPGSSTPLEEYTVSWECKNADKTDTDCDSSSATFDFDLCSAVPVPAACSSNADWTTDGVVEGSCPDGVPSCATSAFPLCTGSTVICRFTNSAGLSEQVCLESFNAAGDLQVIGGVQPEQVSFTTAAVSVPEADLTDRLFLASFMPIADESRWPGTVDHFVEPLPVIADADGNLVPDKGRVCADSEDTSCLAWDAQVQILTQAPTDVAASRSISIDPSHRRVTYTQDTTSPGVVPLGIRKFDYGASDVLADEKDLWRGMGIEWIDVAPPDTASEDWARDQAQTVIRETLKQHIATLVDPDTLDETQVTYLLGDLFHASPVLLGGPANFFYLANDLGGNGQACTVTGTNANRGYRCFFEKQRRRRKVLLAPSNDGQLHAFDAGFYSGSVVDQQLVGDFDLGTGKEIFAHIPRPMLAHTRNMVTLEHAFGIDGGIQVDDVFIDRAHTNGPTAADRAWRTVVFGSYREGARGIFALDVTSPDPVDDLNVTNFAAQADVEWVPQAGPDYVPLCSALNPSPPLECDGAYPAMLWEFTDECTSSSDPTVTEPCDEDSNGVDDLAFSWSKVNTGRVRVLPHLASVPEVRFVAIFGGGLDPENRGTSGNFLYMVDVETGKTLWKRVVEGAVPSEPAAVDTDQNGILDTLYVGTTAGKMYKVDLSAAGQLDSAGRVIDSQWSPFAIFDTEGREIFFPPTVIFEGNSGRYALAFGTGDRQDLWSEALPGEEGRFYVMLDQNLQEGVPPIDDLPLVEGDFLPIPVDDLTVTGNLLAPTPGKVGQGWVLQLGQDERLVNDALAISGLLVFPTFDPERPDLCTFGGMGNLYALFTTSATSIGGATESRAQPVEGYASEAVVTASGFSQPGPQSSTIDPFEAARLQSIRDSLMDLFPADCRFGSFSLNVSSSLSSREVLPIAQIPVCIARKNWTEHF